MAKTTPPKTAKQPLTEKARESRAEYYRKLRLKKKSENASAEMPHWSIAAMRDVMAFLPAMQEMILVYRERTAVLSARPVNHGVNAPVDGLTINGAAPAFHPGAGAEFAAVDHGPVAPPGVPSFVVGKYRDDPTGHRPEPLFTMDVELTDDCQAYFRDKFPGELADIREYHALPEPFDVQMQRAMFQRLGLPIPSDDPKVARAFYPRGEESTQS